MKYKVFASQLEAHVGQSPVRGGKAIKTDRKNLNILNQLLSRVKNSFSRKATAVTAAPPATESPTDISVVSDPLLKAALAFSKESTACRLRSKNPDHPATVKLNDLPLAQQEPDVTCIRLY